MSGTVGTTVGMGLTEVMMADVEYDYTEYTVDDEASEMEREMVLRWEGSRGRRLEVGKWTELWCLWHG